MHRPDYKLLSREIHKSNVEAGWWTDINTGKKLDRNVGEMLALIHSELNEALVGFLHLEADDHLPNYPCWQVELADTCIRTFDLLGGLFSEVEPEGFISYPLDFPQLFPTRTERIAYLHLIVTEALEAYRKSNWPKTKFHLWQLLDGCFELATDEGISLLPVIIAKWDYNKSRADHKIENRLKAGGKKI